MEIAGKDKYKVHAFICTSCIYRKKDGTLSSSDQAQEFRKNVKAMAKERWGKDVRVSGVGCLGNCEEGISSVIYPQGTLLIHNRPGDEKAVIDCISTQLNT
jgi:predicted metal-binding protein